MHKDVKHVAEDVKHMANKVEQYFNIPVEEQAISHAARIGYSRPTPDASETGDLSWAG
jgi:hypothetical protein